MLSPEPEEASERGKKGGRGKKVSGSGQVYFFLCAGLRSTNTAPAVSSLWSLAVVQAAIEAVEAELAEGRP